MKKTQLNLQLAIGCLCLMAFSFVSAAETAPTTLPEATTLHVRTLAASCAACHGGLGNPVEAPDAKKSLQLAGIAREKFMERLANFKSGKTNSTVMHHHAKGLTEAEVGALADFFAAQQVQARAAISSQAYQMPHLD